MENNGHYIEFENVTVLSQASYWRKLLIKETLMCNKSNPNLMLTNPPFFIFI